MKKIFKPLLKIFVFFALTSFTLSKDINSSQTSKPEKSKLVLHQKNLKAFNCTFPVTVIVEVNNTAWYNGCKITIHQNIAYVFNSQTLILEAIYLSSYSITINCSGVSINFARPGNEITYEVDRGSCTDVHFATTESDELNILYSTPSFKSDYITLVNANIP